MAKKFKIEVTITASNFLEATAIQAALQNIANLTGDDASFITELADRQTAVQWIDKIKKIANNPLVKKLAGAM